ncbi:MAG: hypothetical protein JRD87_08180 [Deltaproteobacteria bacterium]|nr:hypothetical protein [Deltaproteobacteria bacterium]
MVSKGQGTLAIWVQKTPVVRTVSRDLGAGGDTPLKVVNVTMPGPEGPPWWPRYPWCQGVTTGGKITKLISGPQEG